MATRKPGYLRQPFEEAVKYFTNKRVVTSNEFAALSDAEKEYAFTIAGVHREDFLNDVKGLISRMLGEEGMSYGEFAEQFEEMAGRSGWGGDLSEEKKARRIYTIADTNIRQATKRGKIEQMKDSGILSKYRYGIWKHRDSPDARPHHRALHNRALPLDCELFKKVFPPYGFGCRCTVFLAKDEEQVRRLGAQVLQGKLPDPEGFIEKGWEKNGGIDIGPLKEESDAIARSRKQN